jgi:N4-gp56 family major capsid protein
MRIYDQLAKPVNQDGVEQAARVGSAIQVNFLSDMNPGVTAISQTTDLVPQTLRDAYATLTPTSRGEALQWSESLDVQAYTDYGKARVEALGKNQMESVEILARDVATQGSLVLRAAARASLDAGTSTHYLTDKAISEVQAVLQQYKAPAFIDGARQSIVAIISPALYHDLRLTANVLTVGAYVQPQIILNFELGQIGPFKLIVSPWAKSFYGQGAANASAAATTLNGAVKALDKTMIVASATNISAGKWLNILDVAETGNTHSPTNERVKWVSGTTTVTLVGEGANGGLRFDHVSGVAVTNADSVHTAVFGGPMSFAKAYDSVTGEFGEMVGPKVTGLADQFASIAWKFYGGYGRWVESWLVRGEYSTSLEA